MKSQQLSLFALVACFCVLLATALPMDTPSGSKPDPRLSTETAVKGTFHSSDAYFGSEEHYVENVKECDRFKENPSQKNSLKTIYVTSQVFMACQFNPTDFPHLRNVNIELVQSMQSHLPSASFWNLPKDPGFIAFKDAKWTDTDPFILNTFYPEGNHLPLESLVIKEKQMDWVEFLLKHRDWKRIDDPFNWWDNMLFYAFDSDNADAATILNEIEEKYSFLQGRDPFLLELTISKHVRLDPWFRGHVDEGFKNALIAVRSKDVNGVKKWLEGNPTPEQISRVLNAVLSRMFKLGSTAAEFQRILMNDPRLDLKFRDREGRPLVLTAIESKNWGAFDILIGKEGIEVNSSRGLMFGTLIIAMSKRITLERFQRLLNKGVNTFERFEGGLSPLISAGKRGLFEFAEEIIEKRKVPNAQGGVVVQLTANERRKLGYFPDSSEMFDDYPIETVQVQ